MFKKLASLAASIFAVATTNQALAADSLLDRINNKGTITVGTEGTYPPFSYHDESNKLTGYDVEVTRAVAEKLGVKVEFKETVWDSMMAGLKAGRFDIVANQVALTTPERRATFDRSEPYNWSGEVILARADETRVTKPEDVKGLKAAQAISSNHGELAVKNQAEIVPVDGLSQSVMLLKQKRADVTFNDELAVLDFLKKDPNSGLKILWESDDKLGSGFIVNKGNDEALAKISAAVLELQKDGTLKKLGEQFFGKDISVK